MKAVTPTQAKSLLAHGAVLIDVRGAGEHARERIPGSRHLPLTELEANGLPCATGDIFIFYCRSGHRTMLHAGKIAACLRGEGGAEIYILEGGLDAWKRAGLDVHRDSSQPIELQRQVHLAAGSLILLGVTLGAFVHPGFYVIAAGVGAGLMLAGLTGFCGMARLLMKAPWNRRATHTASD